MEKIIGLKQLRENVSFYADEVQNGRSFIIIRRSRPLFKIVPVDAEENWELVVDFTAINPAGVALEKIISRL